MKRHFYKINVEWTGNGGQGTKDYKSYLRNHSITGDGKGIKIEGSSDPNFRGDSSKYNPEDLFLSSLSSCHMLWYLHLCSVNNVIVNSYSDIATGIMQEAGDGGGKFIEVTLNPIIEISDESMRSKALELHAAANQSCFIANSCNFEILHRPIIKLFQKNH